MGGSAAVRLAQGAAMNRWKQAVVHLECATDSEHFGDRIKRIAALQQQRQEGSITPEEFAGQLSGGSRDIRSQGTAIFLEDGGRHYLVTARHVLLDELAALREIEEEQRSAQSTPEPMRQSLVDSARERAERRIFGIVFRVPNLDEVIAGTAQNLPFLMNLGAGVPRMAPFTFSAPELDLAIVSLDQRDRRFADDLIVKGFRPIALDDIADGPTEEGAEIFTVGYPAATALVYQISQHAASANWSSSYVSLPAFAFGRVSMLHSGLRFFWADMSVYPGNSGGPVIESDKLVGVVSHQPLIRIDVENTDPPLPAQIVELFSRLTTRIPFGNMIKAGHIRALLDAQKEKDNRLRG
jgi:hypothetical protein